MFPKIILIIAIVALLSACAVPPATNPAPTETLTATPLPTASQTSTSTPTPTSTPEATATPEGPRMEIITVPLTRFDKENKETADIVGFFVNVPENASNEVKDQLHTETIQKAINYIDEKCKIKKGIMKSYDNLSPEVKKLSELMFSMEGLYYLPGHQNTPSLRKDKWDQNPVHIMLMGLSYNNQEGTHMSISCEDDTINYVYLNINGEIVSSIIESGNLSLPTLNQ